MKWTQISLWDYDFIFLDIYWEVKLLYGHSLSNFAGNFHTLLHSGYTSLHLHQWCTGFPFSITLQTLFIIFWMNRSNNWEVISYYGLIWVYLMISDFDHIFMYLFAICRSSLEKCKLRFSNQFKLFVSVEIMSTLYILDINAYKIYDLQTFSPIL